MTTHYHNPTMDSGAPGPWEKTPKDVSIWRKNPTTTLKEEFLRSAIDEILDYRMMDLQVEQMYNEIIRLEEVPATAQIIETQYKFEGAFHARAEHGPFQVLQTSRTNRAVMLSLLGMGVEFSWERLIQDTPELKRVAEVVFTRLKEANMLAALRAMALAEMKRLSAMNGNQLAGMLMYVYRGMAMNEQEPRLRDRFVTEASTFLRGGIKRAYTPAGIENVFGTPNGPTVVPMRVGVDSMLTSSLEEQIEVSEYMRFVDLYDRRDFVSATDRDIRIFDHANQTKARLSFSETAARALAKKPFVDQTWNQMGFFKNRPETQMLYGRAKLLAAGLPLESPEFALLVQIAADTTTGKWIYATETVIAPSNILVSEETKRNLVKGKALWETMYRQFKLQNPNNSLLGAEAGDLFNQVLSQKDVDTSSILSVASLVGGYDVLNDAGRNGLVATGVNLPIDLIVVRRHVRAQFGHMIISNGEPCLNVYYSRPIAGANIDSTNMTKYASISFGNAATVDDDINRRLMVVRGAIYRHHVEGTGGADDLSLDAVALPPGHSLGDVLALTKMTAEKFGGKITVDGYVAEVVTEESAFVEGDDEILQTLAECAVRSAYAYLARDGREVLVCNPNAPAHLTAPLRASC